MLSVREIYFRHRDTSKDIIKGISFDCERGSITSILGPNGSGKSTLFKCIAGLWKFYKGEIYFDKELVDKLSFKKRARIFAVVPQDHEPPFPYSVLDIVLTGRASYISMFSSPTQRDNEIAIEALKIVGIENLKDRPYTKISGGERQLALIARALSQQTPVILLDEPTSHLDYRNQINILSKIKEIAIDKKRCVVMTLHDPNLASLFSDKVIIINSGKKVIEGVPKEVITEEIIKKVYDVKVTKYSVNGYSIICPII